MNNLELLAPAGNIEKMKYALAYGADAVYAGIPRFSLRTKDNDFRMDTIKSAIDYTHENGRKIYLTLNAFPHNSKIESFQTALQMVAELKPDGIILADPGVIMLAAKYCPEIPVHLSTQANTVNWAAVKFWQSMGVKRIILSRELSLKEISEIRQRVPEIELEAFVHGAICIAYSGRCLLSNYFNHRDANQGTCTNSCRWEYNMYEQHEHVKRSEGIFLEEKERPGDLMPIEEDEHGTYIMNSKDLNAIHLLAKMRDAGIDSFKIEGRSKSIYYVSVISRAYRQALDELQTTGYISEAVMAETNAVSNRGYISGFLERNPGPNGEDYSKSGAEFQSHVFAGVVNGYDPQTKRLRAEIRNRIEVGNTLEVMTPAGNRAFIIKDMFNLNGQTLDTAHGGNGEVYIGCDYETEPFALLRLKLTTETVQSQ